MPGVNSVHINQALSNFAVGIVQNTSFPSDLLLPAIPVQKEKDSFFVFGDEELRLDYNLARADGAPATEIDFGINEDEYSTKNIAARKFLTDRQLRNQDPIVRLEQKTVRKLMTMIKLSVEFVNHALLDDTDVFDASTPDTLWDAEGADILGDIDAAIDAFMLQAGIEPNKIVIPPQIARVMAADETFLELQKYTKGNLIEGNGLPPVIRNMQVLVPGTRIVTTEPGIETVVGRVWKTNNVGIYYVNPLLDEETFTVGVQFRVPISGLDVAVKTYRLEDRDGVMYQAQIQTGTKILTEKAGYILEALLTEA